LEKTLVKELKKLNVSDNIKKISGRKIIEVKGDQSALWTMLYKSRIAEDI
jgi:23S rRNA G2445 N2-methylase RlmL